MPSGITLIETNPAVIPTPDAGKDTFFIDSTAAPIPIPSYKDSAGVVHSLQGSNGTSGTNGLNGPPGMDGQDADSWPISVAVQTAAGGSGSGQSAAQVTASVSLGL